MASITIASVEIPPFQRDRIQPHIEKMAAEWDETAYAFPHVAVFEGGLICIDGQQRLAACEKRGKETAIVVLIDGVRTKERLANLFLKINRDRKLLNAFQKFIAAHYSKDRGSLEIARIVKQFGLEVSKSATANGKIPAGAITQIHEFGGGEILTRTLRIREMAWGATASREANEGKTLLGLGRFLKRYTDKVDDERLISILAKQHPGYILQAIDRRRGISQITTYSDYLRDQYNKGLRGKGKL